MLRHACRKSLDHVLRHWDHDCMARKARPNPMLKHAAQSCQGTQPKLMYLRKVISCQQLPDRRIRCQPKGKAHEAIQRPVLQAFCISSHVGDFNMRAPTARWQTSSDAAHPWREIYLHQMY